MHRRGRRAPQRPPPPPPPPPPPEKPPPPPPDELPGGVEIVSIITVASVDSLGLREGQEAYAVIKASNVMIGADHD